MLCLKWLIKSCLSAESILYIYIHIVKDNLCSAQYKHYFRVLMEMVFDDDDNDA